FVLASLLLSGITLLPLQLVHAATDTCIWTGANSGDWSDSGNWSNCDNGHTPENNDFLQFPVSASNKSMNNDLSGFTAGALLFYGNNYTLGGNDLTVDSGTGTANIGFIGNADGNDIQLNLTLHGTNSNSTVGSGDNTISGDITFNLSGAMDWDQSGDI